MEINDQNLNFWLLNDDSVRTCIINTSVLNYFKEIIEYLKYCLFGGLAVEKNVLKFQFSLQYFRRVEYTNNDKWIW